MLKSMLRFKAMAQLPVPAGFQGHFGKNCPAITILPHPAFLRNQSCSVTG
jgi:hypothetical protein